MAWWEAPQDASSCSEELPGKGDAVRAAFLSPSDSASAPRTEANWACSLWPVVLALCLCLAAAALLLLPTLVCDAHKGTQALAGLCFLWPSSSTTPAASHALPLAFPRGRPLKVLIISDVHYGEAEDTAWGPQQDVKSTRVITSVLDLEHPDFVVFLGDQVTGENLVNATNATAYLGEMLAPLVSRGIPFASTYGNHDISNSLSRGRMYEYEKGVPGCNTLRSDPSAMPGVTNYVLHLHSGISPGRRTPVAQFVFLDSNGITGLVNASTAPAVDWVQASQLQVLRRALEDPLPTFVFFHIPLAQFSALNTEFQGCCGLREEEEFDVQSEDEGLWDLLVSSPNVVAAFSGHQHGTAWCCPVRRLLPLTICFGRHSGYGGYGSWARGARVLSLEEPNPLSLHTWVRMENGSLVDEFVVDSPPVS